jgi:hypothetical protein
MSTSHLRPLAFGEILDGAFVIYRRHFATLFVTALIPLVPTAVGMGAFGFFTAGTMEADAAAASAAGLFLLYPVMLLATAVMWAALIQETASAVEGRPVDRGAAYRAAFRRLLPLVAVSVVVFLLAALGFLLLIVPGILVMIALFAVWHVVVLEERGPLEALARSRELARGAWLRILGVWFVSWIIVMIPSLVVGTVAGAAAFGAMLASGDPDAAGAAVGWVGAATNVLSVLLSALTTPFMVAALTLLYYDRRVRTDAMDLEVEMENLPTPV